MAKSSDAKRLRERERDHDKVRDSQELPAVPPPANPVRRAAAERSLRAFLETYFPLVFNLRWASFHLKAIDKLERSVLEGGLFAMAMPRGSGKTTLCERAALWAILTGRRQFIMLIGSTKDKALDLLRTIKTELETNEDLAADFPEACQPIAALEGSARRCEGQRGADGNRTRIKWGASEIVLATLPDWNGRQAACSGAIVRVVGIDGAIRGAKFMRADGTQARPDLVLLDDPQRDDRAANSFQVGKMHRVISSAVMRLAGPGKKIAGVMPCTVIFPDDLADRLLDRKKHPEWQGERTQMMQSLPKNEALWAKYAEILADGQREERGIADATAFYLENRAALDEGAEVSWEDRFNEDEASAIQSAMNIKIEDENAFWSEFQNKPRPIIPVDDSALTLDALTERLSKRDRGVVPDWATKLVAFCDLQKAALFWVVCGFAENFRGTVVDYGVYPEQPSRHFTLTNLSRRLGDLHEGSDEAVVLAGLRAVEDLLLGRAWQSETGASLSIGRLLFDAQWGKHRDQAYEHCKTSHRKAIVMPSHGATPKRGEKGRLPPPRPKPGERTGHHWRIPPPAPGDVRHITFIANHWKTFAASRLRTPDGDPGSVSLYGSRPGEHRLFAEHLTSEFTVEAKIGEDVETEWRLKPNRDNHWWDGFVGCCVAASEQGCVLPGVTTNNAKPKRPRINLRELQQQRRMQA